MICIIVHAYPGDLLLHLESFVVLRRHLGSAARGAFEHAAHDLGVDRSVLRRRIQTLTTWIGTPLLQGRGTQMVPSAAGLRLAERAVTMLSAAQHLKAEVALLRSRLTVACTGTITTELLPRVLIELEKGPRPVQLAVRRAGGSACERLVRNRDVDLGVVRLDAPPMGLASQHLAADRLWLVLPSTHPLSRARAKPSLLQIAKLPLILFGEASRTRARVMERLAPLGAVIRVEVDGKASALEYVRANLGASFLSLLPGHRATTAGVWACDVTALFGRSGFYVIGRRDRWEEDLLSAVVRRLVHHARRPCLPA
jgi:DNA-binding transcriptional LysR family regulator